MIALRMVGTVFLSLFFVFNIHAGETKKVCNTQKDKKGKEVEVCREIKIHKKLDATKVPPK
jgi:hypothetical protein